MTRFEPMAHDLYPLPPPDLTRILEEHLATSFPPDLAFDLVLNELVVRAADATGASSAALALWQGEEFVCRAATGVHAPGLGVPLHTRDGLPGACVRTRTPQLCNDAESDSRVDAAALRGLGIRSMLIVPVFDQHPDEAPEKSPREIRATGGLPELIGIIEVFSPVPGAFSTASRGMLEEFAHEVAHVRRAARHLQNHASAAAAAPPESELLHSFDTLPNGALKPASAVRPPYETWTLILGALVIFAAIGVSFMVGSRVGWLNAPAPALAPAPAEPTSEPSVSPAAPALEVETPAAPTAATRRTKSRSKASAASTDNPPPASSGELVVYDKGKVIFRIKPPAASAASSASEDSSAQRPARGDAAQVGSSVVPAASNARMAGPRQVWLSPEDAQARLLSRAEPEYPADALAARHSGNVVLEVNIAEDGSVASARVLSGDPLLAAAATEAVRGWRYRPYLSNGQPMPFQTTVTVSFSPPN
jgi:TonB family protein